MVNIRLIRGIGGIRVGSVISLKFAEIELAGIASSGRIDKAERVSQPASRSKSDQLKFVPSEPPGR